MTRRVLIADDDEDMRELISVVLRSGGYTVVGPAIDGDDALDIWRRERSQGICAVILDQRMPGPTGISVATTMRAEDPDQQVLLLSAHLDPSIEELASVAGIAACVHKQDVLGLPRHAALVSACTCAN